MFRFINLFLSLNIYANQGEIIMEFYLAVFRSRTDTLSFIDDMKRNSAYAVSVSTPKQTGLGCGISAKFLKSSFSVAKRLIAVKKYKSFYGFIPYNANLY